MIHPASQIEEPNRDPDFMSFSVEIWFHENVYSWKQGNMEWQVCPMMVCPLTGELMYMMHTWPLAWVQVKGADIKETYMRFLVEKEMLGVFDETSGQESPKT